MSENTSRISHINAEHFGMLPVVRGNRAAITVRHPVYGEFVLRLQETRYGTLGVCPSPEDYYGMLQRLTVLRLHIPDDDPACHNAGIHNEG